MFNRYSSYLVCKYAGGVTACFKAGDHSVIHPYSDCEILIHSYFAMFSVMYESTSISNCAISFSPA